MPRHSLENHEHEKYIVKEYVDNKVKDLNNIVGSKATFVSEDENVVQLYSDYTKTKKTFPKTIASEVYMEDGSRITDYLMEDYNPEIDLSLLATKAELSYKYDDISISNNELSMKSNGIIKKTILLPTNSGGSPNITEGHIHSNKESLDTITPENLISWNNKVDVIDGKVLSSNDYTNGEKSKLNSLINYDDIDIRKSINEISEIKLDGHAFKWVTNPEYIELVKLGQVAPNIEYHVVDSDDLGVDIDLSNIIIRGGTF